MAAGMEGGRFDFNDGGSFVGEWYEGRAQGLGVATGPENQGEYSGEWNMGFESKGVYIWPSGNIYCGTWLKGKRHGEGVQVKGRWVYRGSFTTGFCGRYGVKESLTSCAKYEGSWHLNRFDGFGVETNSDGSIYAGGWSKGMRQGLGVRRSAPYALAAEFYRAVRAAQSQNSLPSGTDSERGWRGTGSSAGGSGGDVRNSAERGRPDERRSGFVLRSTSCPSPASQTGYRSSTPSSEKKSLFKRGIFRKLRKQKSTGDLSMVGSRTLGGFSTTGCGASGGLFQNRGRRPGGSLRSNISTSSQMTTNSFGRGDLKGLANTGQGLHELMDEPVGPNVTETYSGQWNEDRRSGYGVAERSDGLRYAGEWFNNKKDGYGVTYRADGTKEEGKYKENILIQPLNRRSKLFMLRHTKLRDAIEEAVKNAEEVAKKAQENAFESAYQRAQTARTIADKADICARDALKLSEEARAIAREFSPEFVQLGLIWEKQNPLLKKEIFGLSSNREEEQSHRRANQHTYSQNLIKENTLAPETSAQLGNRLEVSGGSRQGSFRSSFRRHANTLQNTNLSPSENYDPNQPNYPYDYNPQMANQNRDQNQFNAKEFHGTGRQADSTTELNYHGTPNQHNSLSSNQRAPGGRPISRAATTGFTGLGYSEQQQLNQHMAQHPHSPYLMASASQHLDTQLDQQMEINRVPEYNRLSSPKTKSSATVTHHSPSIEKAEVLSTRLQTPTEIKIANAQLVQPAKTYRALFGLVDDHQDLDYQYHQNYSKTMPAQSNYSESITEHWDEMSLTSKERNNYSPTPLSNVPRVRRRTLPSIMTEPPIQTQKSNRTKTGTVLSNTRNTRTPTDRINQNHANIKSIIDDTTVHSAENLPADAAAIYIIENGIRKRVQAETHQQNQQKQNQQQQFAHNKLINGQTFHANKTSELNYMQGSRPEWTTAYDPYRPAMESTGVVTPNRMRTLKQHHETETEDLLPLPKSYRIESVIHLPGANKESSMPDISLASNSLAHGDNDNSVRRRTFLYPVSKELTREEVARLSQARRQELYHEMERRKRGEIIIRLADIKDWIRANFVIVFVLLINASLAFFFFNLLTENPTNSNTNVENNLNRPYTTDPNTIIAKTVKTAKHVVNSMIKPKIRDRTNLNKP